MADLPGWNSENKIQITIDHTKIDSDLSHFPVTVFETHLSEVFDELSDANRKKIAFTKADGTTELYAEIEKYDQTNEKAIWHVSASGWTISSSVDTIFYIYYDSAHADNTAHIGDVGERTEVWDSNFKMVQHMNQDPSGTAPQMVDSTSNDNDGTSGGSMTSADQVEGQIDGGLDFDGGDDYIDCGSNVSLDVSEITWEMWIKRGETSSGDERALIGGNGSNGEYSWQLDPNGASERQQFIVCNGDAAYSSTNINDRNWHHVAVTRAADNTVTFYLDGSTDGTGSVGVKSDYNGIKIGRGHSAYPEFKGIIDEVHISGTVRSAAWIKADYYSGKDVLRLYTELRILQNLIQVEYAESSEIAGNAIFFGANF